MNNKKLAFLLKLFVVILAALGLVLFGLCIPSLLHELILFYRRTLNEELPLQLLSATAAVILYIALILFWRSARGSAEIVRSAMKMPKVCAGSASWRSLTPRCA